MKLSSLSIAAVAAAAAVASVAAPADAALIGLSSSDPGTLFSINTATGAATPLVDLTAPAESSSLVGLAQLGGVLYATDVRDNTSFKFGSINITTGAFTIINDQTGSANWHGLAADPLANLLYTVDLNDSNNLKSITPAGVVTTIGSAGTNMAGLAFDNDGGILYGVNQSGDLFTIDTTTGVASLIGATGTSTGAAGLAFDQTANILYLNSSDSGPTSLFTVNTTTGAATLVGANGFRGIRIDGLESINAIAVPEPATLGLGAMGLFALAARRRKA